MLPRLVHKLPRPPRLVRNSQPDPRGQAPDACLPLTQGHQALPPEPPERPEVPSAWWRRHHAPWLAFPHRREIPGARTSPRQGEYVHWRYRHDQERLVLAECHQRWSKRWLRTPPSLLQWSAQPRWGENAFPFSLT